VFERSVIDDVRNRNDIVEIISEHVPLKKQGSRWVGRCPFHDEKTPSFSVSRDAALYHCFGCKASGDVIRFVREVEGLDFPEALRFLAERAGVEIPETRDPNIVAEERRQRDVSARLHGACEIAAAFFERALREAPYSEIARGAIEDRGISEETVATFRLGYAPAEWGALTRHLTDHGVSPADAELAGLALPGRRGLHDRFRHRLMFPVLDRSGRVVAFSGRVLPVPEDVPEGIVPPDAGKYINTPETPIFRKHEHLYGLHPARDAIRRSGKAIVVEGNFDVAQMHQHGFRNTVAPLGTAFTDAQGALLRKFADAVTLAFDGDEAGRKARRAAHAVVAKAGLLTNVIVLPQKMDPDSFLRDEARGAQAMAALIAAPMGLVEWLIKDVAADSGPSDEERLAATRGVVPYLAEVSDVCLRQLYVQRTASSMLLPEEMVGRLVREHRASVEAAKRAPLPTNLRPDRTPGMTDLGDAKSIDRGAEKRAHAAAIEAMLWEPSLLASERAEELLSYLEAPMDSFVRAAIHQWRAEGHLDGPSLMELLETSGLDPRGAIRTWVAARIVRDAEDDPAIIDRCPSALYDALAKIRRCREAMAAQATRRESARAGADGDRLGEVSVLDSERERRAEGTKSKK